MDPVQEFWLADMSQTARSALAVLSSFRNEEKAHDEFLSSVLAAVHLGGRGSLVAVGCSPAVRQELIARDIRKSVFEVSEGRDERSGMGNQVLVFPAPPLVDGSRGQLRLLHDRYRVEAGALDIRYKHQPLYPACQVVQRSTEVEALVALLRVRQIKAVIITHGHNLIKAGGPVAQIDLLFRHVADIGRRAGIPHVVIADRASILSFSSAARSADRCRIVLQALYEASDEVKFAAILKGYQVALGDCTDLVLVTRIRAIRQRVGGDPCRFAEWLCDALAMAAREAQKLTWKHLSRTGPRLAQINEANSDLVRYLAWKNRIAIAKPMVITPDPTPRQDATKPGVRRPERDPVPPGITSNAA